MRARRVMLETLRGLGLLRLWRYAHRASLPILMFHGVAPDEAGAGWVPLRPRLPARDFRRYLRVLSRRFRFVSLEEAVEMLSGQRPLESHCLTATFDDGYLNNATVAWPILRQFGATGTFFVPTGYIETGRTFWVDRLDYAMQHLPPGRHVLAVGSRRFPVAGRERPVLREVFDRVRSACLALGWAAAEEVVSTIEHQATGRLADSGDGAAWAGLMSWEHVRSMQQQGASFGSHTVGHSLLDRLSPEDVRRELEDSRSELERRTGQPCRAIAYPVGRFTPELAEMAGRAGYHCAVTTVNRPARPGDTAMALPRVGIPKRPLPSSDLLARVTGLSEALSRVLRPGRVEAD